MAYLYNNTLGTKKYILPFTLLIVCFAACNRNKDFIAGYLSTANLTTQLFTIQTNKDTTVQTKDGIIITVPANCIKANTTTITLQVKEALTLAEMLKAGLTTQSGKDILSSDGMFYIGTAEQSTITAAIHIKLPTENASKNMQLYKGMEKDGKIDWQSPAPMAKTISALSDSGEVLYKANCTSCHVIDNSLVGGPLAWMDKRKSKDWLYAYIRNNGKVMASGDKYANCIACKYNHSLMTIFENLSNRNIDAICRYVDKVSKEEGIPDTFNPYAECDSCEYYRVYYDSLMNKRDSLKINNGAMAKVIVVPPPNLPLSGNITFNVISNKVTPPVNYAEYYQFNITAYGWYNVDILLNAIYGSQNSELRVRVQGQFKYRVSLMLAIPTAKVFAQGGYLENSDDYGFYTTDGKIPLPQGTDAFIIAVSEQNEKLFYSIQHFTTSLSQTIDISLKETDRQSLVNSFEAFHLDSMGMEINRAKNFDGMKAVDAELKRLEVKLEHCACGDTLPSMPSISSPAEKQ